ncbi:hypothetical protein pb186bvf_011932 [Paramecium bursaria]
MIIQLGKPQDKYRENYTILKNQMVGKGQYGSVYKCEIKNKPEFNACVKIIQKKDTEEKLINREIEILKNLKGLFDNPYIVLVYDIYDIVEENCIEIVMEYCEGQDLSQIMKQKAKLKEWFSIEESIKIIKQIVCGYYSLYEKRIIHRDLKPANILISNVKENNQITKQIYKIGDLGMGRIIENMEQANNFTKVGTPAYAAPQLYLENNFSSKVDVYSLGVIFYQLIYQELPISANSMNELMERLGQLKDEPKVCEEKNRQGEVPVKIRNLIESMLSYHEKDRIGWQDLFCSNIVGKQQQIQKRLSFIEQKPKEYQELYRVKQIQSNKVLQLVKALLNKADVASHVYDMVLKQKRQNNLSQEQVAQFSILQVLASGYKHKLMLNIMGLLFDKPQQLVSVIQQFYSTQEPLKKDESIIQELGKLKEFSQKQLSQSTLQYREDECKFYNSNKKNLNLQTIIDLIEEDQNNDFTKFITPINDFLYNQQLLDDDNSKLLKQFVEVEQKIDIEQLITHPPIKVIEPYGI